MFPSRISLIFALLAALLASVPYRTVALAAAPENTAPPADPQIAAALADISAQRIQANIEKLVSFQTRLTLSAQDPDSIKAGHGIGAAREWIKAEFESYSRACGGCLEVKTDSFTENPAERIPKPTVITNVYAVLKGTDPENAKRIVLVTGHYDSRNSDTFDATGIAPGANDDASGTAVSLECARVLSKLKFPATIIFLTVAGEEQGLNGSRHFAKMAKEQGWDIEAALNNDIVGGDRSPQQDPGVVRVFSEGVPLAATEAEVRRIRNLGGENDSASRQLARYVAEVGRTYQTAAKPLLVFRLDRYLRGGDHYFIQRAGLCGRPLHRIPRRLQPPAPERSHRKRHRIRRRAQVRQFRLCRERGADKRRDSGVTGVGARSARQGSAANQRLENDSTLTWEASPGAASYEVLWRDTASPEWEHAQSVGNVTRTTLPLSKDNVIFAVRAVDGAGHRSLPVVPQPER